MASYYSKDLEDCVEGEEVTRFDCGTFGEQEVYLVVKLNSQGKKYFEETGHSKNLIDNR